MSISDKAARKLYRANSPSLDTLLANLQRTANVQGRAHAGTSHYTAAQRCLTALTDLGLTSPGGKDQQ